MLKILSILCLAATFLNVGADSFERNPSSDFDTTPGNVRVASDAEIVEDIVRIQNGMEPSMPPSTDSVIIPVHPSLVNFYLYTKEKPSNYEKLDRRYPTVKDNTKTYVFIVHGWLEHRRVRWYEDLKNALLAHNKNYAVIQVDWSLPAHEVYHISAYNTMDVGNIIGDFILNLSKNSKVSMKNFIVIGHSLGGQTAGFVGQKLLKHGHLLPRIIALDPAGPLFNNILFPGRLSNIDAKVVFVIHTNGGTFGFKMPCGTIDFFPNGGSHQPGCIDSGTIVDKLPCSHQRSWKYFIDALKHPDDYMSKKCINYDDFLKGKCDKKIEVSMGDMETNFVGKFYLKTNKNYVDEVDETQNALEM